MISGFVMFLFGVLLFGVFVGITIEWSAKLGKPGWNKFGMKPQNLIASTTLWLVAAATYVIILISIK